MSDVPGLSAALSLCNDRQDALYNPENADLIAHMIKHTPFQMIIYLHEHEELRPMS